MRSDELYFVLGAGRVYAVLGVEGYLEMRANIIVILLTTVEW